MIKFQQTLKVFQKMREHFLIHGGTTGGSPWGVHTHNWVFGIGCWVLVWNLGLGTWCFHPLGVRAQESASSDWEEIPVNDLEFAAEAEEDLLEEEDPLLEESPLRLSMEFQDANLKDVLKVFSQQTGINVIASAQVGDEPVTIYLEDVEPMDALDQILRAANLTYERPAGSEIYIVKALPEAGAVVTMTRVYRLRFARVSKSPIAQFAGVAIAGTGIEEDEDEEGGGSGGTGGGGTSSGSSTGGSSTGGAIGGAGAGEKTKGIDEILTDLLTPEGSIIVDGRTNRLVITDVPENFHRLEAALAALDVRTAQIMINVEILETSLGKDKILGFDWGTGTTGDFLTLTPGSRSTRFPFGSLGDGVAPTSHTAFTASTLSATSAVGILHALEQDSDTKILARPKILTLDNESAVIRLTTDQAIGFQSVSQIATSTTTTTVEPERETTGVILTVTPQVNDQGFITMLLEPSITKTVASQVTAPSGQSTPIDPKTRSSRTVVRVRSGDTIVVGGLIDSSEQETRRKVPILSGIPFLGEVFKKTEIDNTTSELIVFVTPSLLEESQEVLASTSAPTPTAHVPPIERQQEVFDARGDMIEKALNTLESVTSD